MILKDVFGLVVLNYCCCELTMRNVDLIIRNNSDFNIVIVDNNSAGEDYTILRDHYGANKNVYVLSSKENGGYSKGNNIGIHKLTEVNPNIKYISIMNPDVRITCENIFDKLINRMILDDKIAWIAPLMIERNAVNYNQIGWSLSNYETILHSNMYLSSKNSRSFKMTIPYDFTTNTLRFDVIQGSLFVIRRDIFQSIGFFDENVFMYFEENILSAKLKQYNPALQAAITPDLFYIHEHDYTRKKLKQLQTIVKRKQKSAMYYLKSILMVTKTRLFIFKIVSWFYVNVELPIVDILHKVSNKH